jgi:hypothetical protein
MTLKYEWKRTIRKINKILNKDKSNKESKNANHKTKAQRDNRGF